MRSRTVRKITYRVVFWLNVAVIGGIGAYSVFTDNLLHVWREWGLSSVVGFAESSAPIGVPALAAALIGLEIWLRKLTPPTVVDAVHSVLNDLQRVAFSHLDDLPEYERRVTLFKHTWWNLTWRSWPIGSWLVAFERSGATRRKRVSAFRATLSEPAEAQGIAGQAFANNLVVPTGMLPAVTVASDDATVNEYARRTYVTPEWVRKWLRSHPQQKAPRSICAIPIEVAGKRWGALVLDACGEIKYTNTVRKKQFPLYTGLLARLLDT